MPDEELRGVLAAAAAVFGEVGFYGATLAMIADRAALDPATLEQRYGDSAALLLAALTRRDDADGSQVGIFDRPSGMRLLAGLVGMVRGGMADPASARLHTVISAEAISPTHPAHGWARERYQWMRALFAGAIRRDQEAGLIRSQVDADFLAARLVAVMDGLQLQWLLEPDEVDMGAAFDAYVTDLIGEIAPDGHGEV